MDSSKHTRYVLFGIGAAIGSAVGLVLGSLLTFWIGDETVRAVQRGLRRAGGDDRPNFEMLLQ
ncbi:MAG: hypothetical protein RLZZ387_660 [Chloroflexota bacterium]|jgi:uncharacterized membrane protein